MEEIFRKYAKIGAMTKEQLAAVLNVSPDIVRRRAKAGLIPRVPNIRAVRFDPLQMIELFCKTPRPDGPRSLTTEKRIHGGTSKGGFRKCL